MLSPYYLRDPKLKRLKQLLDELDELTRPFLQELAPALREQSSQEIDQALEALCWSLGVEQVQCEACGREVAFLRSHLASGYNICWRCWERPQLSEEEKQMMSDYVAFNMQEKLNS